MGIHKGVLGEPWPRHSIARGRLELNLGCFSPIGKGKATAGREPPHRWLEHAYLSLSKAKPGTRKIGMIVGIQVDCEVASLAACCLSFGWCACLLGRSADQQTNAR